MIADPKRLGKRQPLSGYNVGYIGFTHCPGLLSDGICYFERWARLSDIAVSHAFVVTKAFDGDYPELVEAHWPVVKGAKLSEYTDDRRTVLVFRRPRGWTLEMGMRIAAQARFRIGARYNTGLILSQLMAHTFVGHYLNKWFNNRPDQWVSERLDRKDEFICSELAATALNEQPELRGKGILAGPLDTISPQALFEDQVIFEPRDSIEKPSA